MRGRIKKLTPLGKYVVKTMMDMDMNRVQLAAKIGTTPQYLSYILNGTRSGVKYLPKIITALELDPNEVKNLIAA